jgi:hypothetical protein
MVPCVQFEQRGTQMKQVSGKVHRHRSFSLIPSSDKEYRKAVHWLETLRLRRTKILEGGYKVGHSQFSKKWLAPLPMIHQSLEMFVEDAATLVKKAFEKYTDNMTYVSYSFGC